MLGVYNIRQDTSKQYTLYMKGDSIMENNYTKKKVKEELENLLRDKVYRFRIVDIDLTDKDLFHYSATVICVETHCAYWVWKDKLDDSISMCLMTVNRDLTPEILE